MDEWKQWCVKRRKQYGQSINAVPCFQRMNKWHSLRQGDDSGDSPNFWRWHQWRWHLFQIHPAPRPQNRPPADLSLILPTAPNVAGDKTTRAGVAGFIYRWNGVRGTTSAMMIWNVHDEEQWILIIWRCRVHSSVADSKRRTNTAGIAFVWKQTKPEMM